MAKGADVSAVLGDGEAEGVSVAIEVETVEGLVASGGVAFAPEGGAGTGVVNASAGLESGYDGFLFWGCLGNRCLVGFDCMGWVVIRMGHCLVF